MSDIDPHKYHFDLGIKLDYFILSADIALLGWTVVNTEWVPKGQMFVHAMAVFWLIIILSVIFGILRQVYNGIFFGLNAQILNNSETANAIEKKAVDDRALFKDQQTGNVISSHEFKKFALPHRSTQVQGEELMVQYNRYAAFCANVAMLLLVAGLFLLALIKLAAL